MQIQHIETFIDLYTTRSFVKTAQNMYLSQSAISQQIKSIERELGCVLFARSSHEMKPTRYGKLFYSYAVSIVTSFNEVKHLIKKEANGLYVHYSGSKMNSVINKAVMEFSYRYPDSNIELQNPIDKKAYFVKDDMETGHVYIVRKTWLGDKPDDDITFVSMGKAHYCCIMSEDNEFGDKKYVTFDEIREKTVVLPSINGNRSINSSPYYEYLLAKLHSDYPETEIVYERNGTQTFSRIVSSRGKMVTIMPDTINVPEGSHLNVKPLYFPQAIDIGMAYKGSPSTELQNFIEIVLEKTREREKLYFDK